MEKIESYRKGRLWLNVFRTTDGELALTIKKSFPSRNGGWKRTDLLRPDMNDLDHMKYLLDTFAQHEAELKYGEGLQ